MEVVLLSAILIFVILIYIEILKHPQRNSEGIFNAPKKERLGNPIYAKTKIVRKESDV